MLFRHDRRQHKNQSRQISCLGVGDFVLHQIAHGNVQPILVLFVFFHLLLDEVDGLFGDVAAVVVEAGVVPEEGEEGVADATAEFDEIADDFLLVVELFVEGDGVDFPFEVGSVLEEVALVEFVELIPDLFGVILCLLILFLRYFRLFLGELVEGFLLHLLRQVVEDHLLFRPPKLIQLYFLPFLFVHYLIKEKLINTGE